MSRFAYRLAHDQRKRGEPAYLAGLHPKQRAFVDDPAPVKTALCGRRAGKTEGVGAWLIDGGFEQPGGISYYIALTSGNARFILWETLREISERYNLGLWLHEIRGQLICELENGHKIWMAGCSDISEIEKFRGNKPYRVAIDEAASFGSYLSTLIDDVLRPSLMDYQGSLALVGTPGLVCAGYFHAVTTGQGQSAKWPTHSWTVLDNPYIPHAADWLAEERKRYGWDEQHPTYQREYLGRWVRDDDAQVYPFDRGRNYYDELPEADRWRWVLSVDIGWHDATAFVLGASRARHPEVYFHRAWKSSAITLPRITGEIEAIRHQYNLQTIVVDTAGGGSKVLAETLKEQRIPCEPAKKPDKLANIHNLRGRLLAGTLKIRRGHCTQLADEWEHLPWNPERTDHHPNFSDDLSDAGIYNAREHDTPYRPELEPPAEGSPEWFERLRQKERKAAQDRVKKRQRRGKVDWRRIARE